MHVPQCTTSHWPPPGVGTMVLCTPPWPKSTALNRNVILKLDVTFLRVRTCAMQVG